MSTENSEQNKAGLNEKIGTRIAEAISTNGVNSVEVIYTEGVTPLPLYEELAQNITGILDSPARWLEARKTLIKGLSANVMVDRDKLSITMVTEERNHFKNVITGKMEFHPAFLKFGINSGVYITPAEMADKIKMNRSFFEHKQDAMNLVATLKDFKATIAAAIEKKNDNQGNVRDLRQMTVTSNMPKSFIMLLPIFKGEKAKKFEVEVYIEAGDLTCTLISPEANEETEALRDSAIDAVIDRIKAVDPTIVILEK